MTHEECVKISEKRALDALLNRHRIRHDGYRAIQAALRSPDFRFGRFARIGSVDHKGEWKTKSLVFDTCGSSTLYVRAK